VDSSLDLPLSAPLTGLRPSRPPLLPSTTLFRSTGLADYIGWLGANFDPSISWKDLEWIREFWDGPMIIKGIQNSRIHSRSFQERSEEHTSELQSRENLVCRLLLEKKNRDEICK